METKTEQFLSHLHLSSCELNGRFDNFALAGFNQRTSIKVIFHLMIRIHYKNIEGASYSLAVKYDKKLDAYLDSVINLIGAAQEPDGYLCTCCYQ
jgi:DUF1680 family protein